MGHRFIPEHSSDGINWQNLLSASDPNQHAFVEIHMDRTVDIGLTIASSNPSSTTEAHISHVTVTGAVEPVNEFDTLESIGVNLDEVP